MIKECKKHGMTKHGVRKDGRVRCKKCQVEAVQRRRTKIKRMAIEYKGGRCEICGYNKYDGALDFHHEYGEKEFGIAYRGYTMAWEKVKKELDKCRLVCANCHREIHGGVAE